MKQFLMEMQRLDALEDLEQNFTDQIVSLIMATGWELDYIMNLGITQYRQVINSIQRIEDQQERKAYEQSTQTFRKPGLLRG